jgi:RND family efflux transporter MFP subunit
MKVLQFLRHHLIGILTLVIVFVAVRFVVLKYRQPGSMTVIEAQAMDMSQSGTPLGSAPVATEKVSLRLFAPTVTYTGTVVALNDEEVYPRVTGWLRALTVYPGQRVHAGQVIGRLDSVELTSRLNEAAAARNAALHEYNMSGEERRQALAQKRATEAKVNGLQNALRDAQSQLTSAQAMRDQAEREQEAALANQADAQANISAMQADVDYWTREIAREQKLLKAGAVSTEEYQREESQAKAAQAKLTQAQAAVLEKRAMVSAAQSKIRQAEAGIASAQARIAQTQADIQGAQADVTAAQANVDLNVHHTLHRKAQVEEAAAQERTADIVRGYTELLAAQDGVVTERLVSPGTLVQPGMAILKIKNVDRLRLQANVAEADLAGIRVGNPVTVTSLRDPNFRLQTRVTSIFDAANAQTRTIIVEALTPNPVRRLVPGQYIVMQIATGPSRRVITVPLAAIRRDVDQKPFVWTVAAGKSEGKTIYACVMHPEVQSDKPGKCYKCGMDLQPTKKGGKQVAHRVYVTLGAEDGRRVVVETGLQEGDEVIYRGQEYLNEGDPVTPTEWGVSGPKTLPAPSGEMPNMPGMSMPGMEGGKTPGTDHGSMPGMGQGEGGGAEPSSMPGMEKKETPPSGGMQNMPGMDHGKMPGMGGR